MTEQGKTMTREELEHDYDAHWEITRQNQTRLGDLSGEVGKLTIRVAAIDDKLDSGFQTLARAIDDNKRQPINLWAVLTVAVGFLALLGSLILYLTNTLQRENDLGAGYLQKEIADNNASVQMLMDRMDREALRAQEDAYDMGRRDATIASNHEQLLSEIEDRKKDAAFYKEWMLRIESAVSKIGHTNE